MAVRELLLHALAPIRIGKFAHREYRGKLSIVGFRPTQPVILLGQMP